MDTPVFPLRDRRLERAEELFLARQKPTIAATLATRGPIELTPSHVAVIRALQVSWVLIESGAPGLSPEFPFGWRRGTRRHAATVLGIRDEDLLARTLTEVGAIVPRLCAGGGSLAPVRYSLPADMLDAFADPDWGVADDGTFVFDERHAVLLEYFNWRTEPLDGPYWPLPFVDGKRPYGDCAYFQIDMAGHLGLPGVVAADGKRQYDDAHDAELDVLHGHMLAALQVFLVHATLPPRCERW